VSKLITFEGIDGSGKSTQAALLYEAFLAKGLKTILTAEPTKRPIGRMIRDIFSGKLVADQQVIAALFAADRLDHLTNKDDGMIHLLQQGTTIISDRYYLSSYAYHSVFVPMDWVMEINRRAAELCPGDLHLFIDVDPEVSMERIRARQTALEIYETKDNLKRVRENYLEAIERTKNDISIRIIDGNRNAEAVHSEILSLFA
jgi:dTMP kinase